MQYNDDREKKLQVKRHCPRQDTQPLKEMSLHVRLQIEVIKSRFRTDKTGENSHNLRYHKDLGRHSMETEFLQLCVCLQLPRSNSFNLVCPLSSEAAPAFLQGIQFENLKWNKNRFNLLEVLRMHPPLTSTYLSEELHWMNRSPHRIAAAASGPSLDLDLYCKSWSICQSIRWSKWVRMSTTPESRFHSLKSQPMNRVVEALEAFGERDGLFVTYLDCILDPRQGFCISATESPSLCSR